MAPAVLERGQRGRVAAAGLRVGLRRAAAADGLHHVDLRRADPQALADKVEFLPRGETVEPEVAAEAARVEILTDLLRERPERGLVQDRDRGEGRVAHAHLGGADQCRGRAAVLGIDRSASPVSAMAAASVPGVIAMSGRSGWARWMVSPSTRAVIAMSEGPLAPRMKLRQDAPALAAFAALFQHGPGAVHRQGAVDLETHVIQPLRPDALDRVAPDLCEAPAHSASGFLRRKLARMLPNRSGVYPCRFMMMYCWVKVSVLFAIQ
jgi:hypothetical protein